MNRRFATVLLLAIAIAVPARADFDSMARAIESKSGVTRTWIPFIGVARMVTWIVSPHGVHDFQLATFEQPVRMSPEELQSMLRRHAGNGFTPIVQVRSKKGESTFIYARPFRGGKRFELLVLSHESSETTLVRVEVDAEALARKINQPKDVSQIAHR